MSANDTNKSNKSNDTNKSNKSNESNICLDERVSVCTTMSLFQVSDRTRVNGVTSLSIKGRSLSFQALRTLLGTTNRVEYPIAIGSSHGELRLSDASAIAAISTSKKRKRTDDETNHNNDNVKTSPGTNVLNEINRRIDALFPKNHADKDRADKDHTDHTTDNVEALRRLAHRILNIQAISSMSGGSEGNGLNEFSPIESIGLVSDGEKRVIFAFKMTPNLAISVHELVTALSQTSLDTRDGIVTLNPEDHHALSLPTTVATKFVCESSNEKCMTVMASVKF